MKKYLKAYLILSAVAILALMAGLGYAIYQINNLKKSQTALSVQLSAVSSNVDTQSSSINRNINNVSDNVDSLQKSVDLLFNR